MFSQKLRVPPFLSRFLFINSEIISDQKTYNISSSFTSASNAASPMRT